jgi:hypothetical protein
VWKNISAYCDDSKEVARLLNKRLDFKIEGDRVGLCLDDWMGRGSFDIFSVTV